MSTRTNVILVSPGVHIKQYYRHYDGYVERTGTDLIRKLSTAFNNDCLTQLISHDATYKQQVIDDVEKLNQTPCLPEWEELPFTFPHSFYDWFLIEMSEDWRLSGNKESWDKNNYEPEEPFHLHGDIEWIYFVDFNCLSGSEARLYYAHLGIGSEIRDKYCNDFSSMYNYIKLNGYNPVTFKRTPLI